MGVGVCALWGGLDPFYHHFGAKEPDEAAKTVRSVLDAVSVPLVMRAPVGATNRGAQHGQSPESYFAHVPGLRVVLPAIAPAWLTGVAAIPAEHDTPMLRRLRDFHFKAER